MFLAAYAWQVLDTGLDPGGAAALEAVMTVARGIFGGDYPVRLALARRRWRSVAGHLLALAVLLVPVFRPLRALRVFTAIGVLNRQLRDDARGRSRSTWPGPSCCWGSWPRWRCSTPSATPRAPR